MQSQRQLQLSLEAHGRYITSLIEREGLQHRLLPQLVAAAGPSLARTVPGLAALAASMPQGSSAQTSDQQTHYMPVSGSGASDLSAQQLISSAFGQMQNPLEVANPAAGPDPTVATASAAEASPSPYSRQNGAVCSNPFSSISQGMFGEPSSPGLLLNTDLQAAAAAWDDQQRNILTGPGSVSGRPLEELPTSLPLNRYSVSPLKTLDHLPMSESLSVSHLVSLPQSLLQQPKPEPQ